METVPRLLAYNNYFKKELPVYYADEYGTVVYEDLLRPLANVLKKRIKKGNQNTILIEGRTNSGKSTIGVQLCMLLDSGFDLEKDYIYSQMDLKKKLRDPTSSPVSLLDEGSVVLNSYNSQRKEDKSMTILMDAWRVKKKTMVICMPSSRDLNKRIKNNHLDYMIKCPVTSPIPGRDPKGFADLYIHEYRDWGNDYWKPIGSTIFSKMDRKTQRKYDRIKEGHVDELIDAYVFKDDDET